MVSVIEVTAGLEAIDTSSDLMAAALATPRAFHFLKKERASAYRFTRASSSICELDLRLAV
eukprot:7387380-Prymnesium_polylepis.1